VVPNSTTQGWVCPIIPQKVLWHFLLIPQLIWMYKCKSLVKLLTWPKDGASSNGMIWSVPNSMTWKHIDEKWLEFVSDVCNIRLKLALEEVNPFGDLSSCHSTWPVVLLNYNLPPWLVKYLSNVALIIPGKESCIGNNANVYLQPLINELYNCGKVRLHFMHTWMQIST
jgi:hypothetical protein